MWVVGDITGAEKDVYIIIELSDKGVVDTETTLVSNQRLNIQPVSQDNLPPGMHTDNVVVKVCNDSQCKSQISGSPKSIEVAYNVILPELSLSHELVEIDTIAGETNTNANVKVHLNTGTNSHPLSTRIDFPSDNLSVVDSPSTVNQYLSELILGVSELNALSSGKSSGVVTFTADISGHEVTADLNVDVLAPNHYLPVPDSGVALTSLPNVSKLTHQVDILESTGSQTINWQATTEATWLSITSIGTTGGSLTITADPTNLTGNQLHMATIIVSSNDPSIGNQKEVNVGFWVGLEQPSTFSSISKSYFGIAADTVRPYVYLQNGETGFIDVYHIYTQKLVTTITGALGSSEMKVSPNGDYLYTVDYTELNGNKVAVIDLNDFSVKTSWESENSLSDQGFVIVHPFDSDILIAGNGDVLFAESGQVVTNDFNHWSNTCSLLDISLLENRMCRISGLLNPFYFGCYELSYSSYKKEMSFVALGEISNLNTSGKGVDVAISDNGNFAYATAGSSNNSYGISKIDLSTMTVVNEMITSHYVPAIESGSNGKLHAGTSTSWVTNSLLIYSDNDNVVREAKLTAGFIHNRSLAVSADGFVSVSATNNSQLLFLRSY